MKRSVVELWDATRIQWSMISSCILNTYGGRAWSEINQNCFFFLKSLNVNYVKEPKLSFLPQRKEISSTDIDVASADYSFLVVFHLSDQDKVYIKIILYSRCKNNFNNLVLLTHNRGILTFSGAKRHNIRISSCSSFT